MGNNMEVSQKIKNGTNILGITEPLCYAIPLLSILEGNKITLSDICIPTCTDDYIKKTGQ